jgi:hypothetical protein
MEDKRQDPDVTTLDALIQTLREAAAMEQDLEVRLAAQRAQRHTLELQVAEYMRSQLGAGLAAEVGQVLVPAAMPLPVPGGPPSAAPEAAPPVTRPAPAALEMRGVNYYPARHPWWRMWSEWAEDESAGELARAAELGINTIRTFLPFSLVTDSPYGAAIRQKAGTTPELVLQRLDRFLDLAEHESCRVILGLFDEADLLPTLIQHPMDAVDYLERVINHVGNRGLRLGEDRRIAMWDLVNELDDEQKRDVNGSPLFFQLKFGHSRQEFTPGVQCQPNLGGMNWLRLIYRQVHALSANYQEITFGVLNPFSAVYLLQQFPDARHVPQYHEYTAYESAHPDNYAQKIAERMHIIPQRTGQHALIGELGLPSAQTWAGVAWTPQLQQAATEIALGLANQNTRLVRGVLLWTLTDWDFTDAEDNSEKYRGLFDANLQPKPVVAVVARAFMHTA